MNKNTILFSILFGVAVLAIIVTGAIRIKGLSDDVVKLSYSILDKDSEIVSIKNYLTKNIALLDTDLCKLINEFDRLGIDTEGDGCVVLLPRNGCGSCMTLLCYHMEDLEVNKNDVYVIAESYNLTMRAELRGSGYKNYYLNEDIFSNIPDSENITLVAFKNRKCKMMIFDIEFPEYVKVFLGYDI